MARRVGLFLAGLLLPTLAMAQAPPSRAAEYVEVDAQRPFEPEGRPLEGLIITLDAGHGGFAHQPGYTGSARGVKSRVVEGDLNMLVAGELYHHLKGAGARVYMTRLDDRKGAPGESVRAEELGARTKLAEETTSHLFLSLHHNAAERKSADGVMILTWPTDKAGHDQPLEKVFGAILREEVEKKVHHAEPFDPWLSDHPLVSSSDIPSAVVEFGFLTNEDFDAWVARRGSHRDEAIGAYNGVVRMWKEHRAELEAKRKELFPAAEEVKAGGGGVSPIESLAKRVSRGSGELSPAAAGAAIALWKKTTLSDATFYHVKVAMEGAEGVWKLTGETNMPQLKATVGSLCEALGYRPLENAVRVLPSEALGEKKFGITQIPMALVWDEPREHSSVQTQLLLGEPVFLLDQNADGTYLLLQGRDAYVGWVRSETIRRMDAGEFSAWTSRPMYTFPTQTYLDDFDIPVGAMLPMGDAPGTFELPKGVRSSGNKPLVTLEVVPPPPFVDHGRNIAERAVKFLTTPYVFGARTWQGVDCSGLVSACYAAEGVVLPRDAFQQGIVGELVATPWYREGLRPGDTLFFLDETGKVYHTGIALGKNRFIHSSPPEVQVSSFDPADPLYSEGWTKQFSFGRRPLP
ncbi:N-acetylmuramoyl-L-alanine amidase [Candidatus Sumerlaeota bacterium]|nr:N-acetylmuramoyl-L-alanine amidase [Candidatus Sumerlaeota bacterium]